MRTLYSVVKKVLHEQHSSKTETQVTKQGRRFSTVQIWHMFWVVSGGPGLDVPEGCS